MAKKKRRRRLGYVDYEDAMADVASLTAEGKVDSEEYEAAIEAATQFFLRDHNSYQFNKDRSEKTFTEQNQDFPKWLTVIDLLRNKMPKTLKKRR